MVKSDNLVFLGVFVGIIIMQLFFICAVIKYDMAVLGIILFLVLLGFTAGLVLIWSRTKNDTA